MQVIQQVFTNNSKSLQQEYVSINNNKSLSITTSVYIDNEFLLTRTISASGLQKVIYKWGYSWVKIGWQDQGQIFGERYTSNDSPHSTGLDF